MGKAKCFTRDDFLAEWSFPLQLSRDFGLHDQPAEFAQGYPKEWGQETRSLDFGSEIKGAKNHNSYYVALSHDQKLLAISSGTEQILIYDIAARKLRQILEGTGDVAFRPPTADARKDGNREGEEGEAASTAQAADKPAYTLVSSLNDKASRSGADDSKLIFWELNQNGVLLDEEERINASLLATKAMEAIIPELVGKHEWTKEFVAQSTLHSDVEKALNKAATEHRRRANTILSNARIGLFGSSPFSNDGKLMVYHHQNRTTQHGMREPAGLPHLVVYDVDAGKEVHRLSGHTDAIMWSSFSPDGRFVASISWDGTMRMYHSGTGELAWATEDSDGQSWSGAFSPDSKHIIWSSAGGRTVQVLESVDGRVVRTFPDKFSDWCRCFAWQRAGDEVALCAGKQAWIWRPFDGPDGDITQRFALDDAQEYHRMASVSGVSWTEGQGGGSLCVEISDGTKMVYDARNNTKMVFKRPQGVLVSWLEQGLYQIRDRERPGADGFYHVSVDGDGKVRFWQISETETG